MKKGILIISICILASILIFETSKYTAMKSYRVEETKEDNSEAVGEVDEDEGIESEDSSNMIASGDDSFNGSSNGEDELVGEDYSDKDDHIDIADSYEDTSSDEWKNENAENIDNDDSGKDENSDSLDVTTIHGETEETAELDSTQDSFNTDLTPDSASMDSTQDLSNSNFTEDIANSDSVDSTSTASSENKRMLVFLDVYKESYQVEVDPLVKKHDYDLSCFVNDGVFTRYIGDDRYTYRLGMDVSHHDGEIDWKAVKEAGIDFVILRIGYRGYGSEGTLNEDKMFRTYIDGAHEAGLDVGCYVFSQAINEDEAREEAQLVLDVIKGYDLELPVVYDPESILYANARTDYVSGEQFTANTLVFCKMIKDAGYQPMIYSNMLWEAFEFDLKQLSDYPIWYADYEPLPQTPYNFEYWQYSNTGNIPGVAGMVDLDIQLIKK